MELTTNRVNFALVRQALFQILIHSCIDIGRTQSVASRSQPYLCHQGTLLAIGRGCIDSGAGCYPGEPRLFQIYMGQSSSLLLVDDPNHAAPLQALTSFS